MTQSKQRVITVPKDTDAQQALDLDTAISEQLIEMQLSEQDFLMLYSSGVFALINEVSGAIIDDHEDEHITNQIKIKDIIPKLVEKEESVDTELKGMIGDIRKLFEEALSRGTGVHFYF